MFSRISLFLQIKGSGYRVILNFKYGRVMEVLKLIESFLSEDKRLSAHKDCLKCFYCNKLNCLAFLIA